MKPRPQHKRKSTILKALAILLLFVGGFILYFNIVTHIAPPDIQSVSKTDLVLEHPDSNLFVIHDNALRLNRFGLWEMYLEGSPYEIGLVNGKLSKHLIQIQEDTFVEKIKKIVPSTSYLRFLKYLIGWFTRDIDEHIPQEYLQEIYGVSQSAADGYEYIGEKYNRMLNYHAAHDIGHALQDLALVGCTSFAANMNLPDSNLIIGRNFDFYVSDAFAANKIAIFVKPQHGYRFMYLSWASMIGVVSGMNMEGLTVTLNAAKSDIPYKAATPISILAREILQYASTIEEAVRIAEKRQTFVSESLLIGSANDNKAVVIEKSVNKMAVYEVNGELLVCSNHYQSEAFADDVFNSEHKLESASVYRQDRCQELLDASDQLDYKRGIEILRNRKGLLDADIGMGNEKAMCQLISHHGIIFEPEKRIVRISTSPYQLGKFLTYDLNMVFGDPTKLMHNHALFISSEIIEADSSFSQSDYDNFELFKEQRKLLLHHISEKTPLSKEDEFINNFVPLNPNYFQTYVLLGDYYYNLGEQKKASYYFDMALKREFEKRSERKRIEGLLASLQAS